MAITGRFEADFSSFYAAVQQADVALKGFEQGAVRVQNSLTKMTNSLSGTKIIQDAALMTEAVNRIGGVSKLTENELARVVATATEATAKMRAMGVDVPPALHALATTTRQVPPGLQQITTAAGRTTGALGSFHAGLLSADRSLASMGFNIGPQVRALDELASASGKTASQIGYVGTAGLALAAGLGGWQIGRMVAEFFNLDQAIGNATAKLLGWGDVAGQVAGAKMDAIALAIKRGADATITFTEAIKFNTEWTQHQSESFNTSAHRVNLWQSEIAKVTADGQLKALTADMASQNSTMQELSDHYGISTRALEFLARETKTATDAQTLKTKADEAAVATMAKLTKAQQDHINSIADKLFGNDDIKRATDYAAAIGRVENVSNLSADALAELAKVMEAGVTGLIAAGRGTDDLTSKFTEMGLAATKSGREAAAAYQLIRAEAAITASAMALAASIAASGSGIWTSDMPVPAAAKSKNIWTNDAAIDPYDALHRAGGGPVSGGQAYMVGERGPELFIPGSSGSISPNGGSTQITIYVNGTAEDVARKVMAEITKSMKVGRKWPAT